MNTCGMCLVALLLFNCIHSANAQANMPVNRSFMITSNHSASEFLYKIVSKENWQKSLMQQEMCLPPFDSHFIHLANKEQVPHVAKWHVLPGC